LTVGAIGGYYFGKQVPSNPDTASTKPLSQTEEPKHDVSPATLQAAWTEFKNIVGEENVSTQQAELKAHSGSEWSTYASLPGDVPFAILKPGSTEDVSEIMKVCHRRKIPVTAYSGGTSP
jgi:D-lactate dehydrogenase (cytochrome)